MEMRCLCSHWSHAAELRFCSAESHRNERLDNVPIDRTFKFVILSISSSDWRYCKRPMFNGMTLLHSVACFAPFTLVTRMVKICPEMTFARARDCLGRTALHVAAAAGCRASPALIKSIAKANPVACDAADDDGNTPLHLECDSSCVLFEFERPLSPQEPPDHDAISISALLSLSEWIHNATTIVVTQLMFSLSRERVVLLMSPWQVAVSYIVPQW